MIVGNYGRARFTREAVVDQSKPTAPGVNDTLLIKHGPRGLEPWPQYALHGHDEGSSLRLSGV